MLVSGGMSCPCRPAAGCDSVPPGALDREFRGLIPTPVRPASAKKNRKIRALPHVAVITLIGDTKAFVDKASIGIRIHDGAPGRRSISCLASEFR
jgi:hypothetical protein